MFDLILSTLCLLLWLWFAWDVRSIASIKYLSGAREIKELPSLSIIIAARNEEKTIGPALSSVLALDYPNLEVIVVNDRSEDQTGEILNEFFHDFQSKSTTLKVVHITRLPTGWLGKNHALHIGAAQVKSKWTLFTDADIHFKPLALRHAISIAEESNLDHIAVLPHLEEHSPMLGIALATTLTLFMMFMRPWKISTSARHYAGIGPFNLVKTATYQRVGGHEPIKMRPDDDTMLAKLIKINNGRSDYVLSDGEVRFSWYETVGELIMGLSKNTYASLEYSLVVTLIAVTLHFFMFVWPVVALFYMNGIPLLMYLSTVCLTLTVSCSISHAVGGTLYYGLGTPIGALLLIYILLRTVIVTHYHGGIQWRGTIYSLQELRKNVL